MEQKSSWSNLRLYPKLYLAGLKKATKLNIRGRFESIALNVSVGIKEIKKYQS